MLKLNIYIYGEYYEKINDNVEFSYLFRSSYHYINYYDGTPVANDEITGVAGVGEYATSDWINTLRGQNIHESIRFRLCRRLDCSTRRPNGQRLNFSGELGEVLKL